MPPLIEPENEWVAVKNGDWALDFIHRRCTPDDAAALLAFGHQDVLPGEALFFDVVAMRGGGLYVRPNPIYVNERASVLDDRWRRILPVLVNWYRAKKWVETLETVPTSTVAPISAAYVRRLLAQSEPPGSA